MSATARLAGLAIVLAAFGVRHYRLGAESLWYDETFSAYLAKQSVPDLIAHTARDIHPPGYYLLLHGWQMLTAASPAHGLEYLQAWAGLVPAVLIVALTFALGRRLGGPRTALLAAALAAIHPPQVWFSQEVRMYSWGALLILLTLWAVLHIVAEIDHPSLPSWSAWGLYVVAAAAACYTLYYAVFWLVVVNAYVLWVSLRHRGRYLGRWLLAQLVVGLVYLPWLPTFIRQAIDPPVPPWREPWRSPVDALAAAAEALAALVVGHTPPLGANWLWAILAASLIIAFFVYAKEEQRQTGLPVLLLVCGPIVLLLLVTAVGLPIYHVRYVALFATAVPLLAGLLVAMPGPPRRAAVALLTLVVLASLGGLRELWYNPVNAADDHRRAVADLAAQWRPGDVILVNAGWVYTAIDVYWPRELTSPADSLPPDIAGYLRLGDPLDGTDAAPTVIRTGSIDAPADLGWGLPESDFFALSATAADQAITDLARHYTRLWHYRLYDTVNDPTGVIRVGLQRLAQPTTSEAYPGPSYLLLERYDLPAATPTISVADHPLANYSDGPPLLRADLPDQSPAGRYLYVRLTWRANDATGDALAVSLRALRGAQLLAQRDADIPRNETGDPSAHTLALAIPAGTPPGPITLKLLVYRRADLSPLFPSDQPETAEVALGDVDLTLPPTPPSTPAPLARFDYIELVAADALHPQDASDLVTRWTWRPKPSPYRDDYTALVSLRDSTGAMRADWRVRLGGESYPSSQWAADYAVTQEERLPLPTDLPPGDYRLIVGIRRTADDLAIPAARRWPWQSTDEIDVAKITLPGP